MKDIINIYTDSASFNNGRKIKTLPEHSCSAGVIVKDDTIIYGTYNYNPNTTISYGELFAIYMMLDAVNSFIFNSNNNNNIVVNLYSDSNYSVSSLKYWKKDWKKKSVNGLWYNSSYKPIPYQEMFEDIENILNENLFEFNIYHIKGHINVKKEKDIIRAKEVWNKINKGNVSGEELVEHSYFNNICDRYAVKALEMNMKGEIENNVRRKSFKKWKEVRK